MNKSDFIGTWKLLLSMMQPNRLLFVSGDIPGESAEYRCALIFRTVARQDVRSAFSPRQGTVQY
jgi:hypothetical protein